MLILLREDGKRVSWWWHSETGDYAKRENGVVTQLTPREYLNDVCENGLKSTRCDGMQKWIEAGRPR
jgi:hypothetical protein